jgi:3-deoxy-D-manno-octulosonic-acid transferase
MSAGWDAVLWKKLEETRFDKPLEVIVVDTIGLLTRLYALSDIAYVGGSLVNAGGHNPLEPAAFSKPIFFGPDMGDFENISRMLLASGGGFEVLDADGLYEVAAMLLGDREKAGEAGHRAFEVFSNSKGAVENVLNQVERWL